MIKITIRPRRKRMCLQVHPDGEVEVLVPPRTRQSDIDAFIADKANWIVRAQQKQKDRAHCEVRFESGARFWYLGEWLTLVIEQASSRSYVVVRDGKLVVLGRHGNDPEKVRRALVKWYKEQAKAVIVERVEYWADKIGVRPNRIRIKSQKTKWGSCSILGNLNYNWKLIMMPMAVLDYVVVHELCHLMHMNHSVAFWALVKRYMPDYKLQRRWLKDEAPIVDI